MPYLWIPCADKHRDLAMSNSSFPLWTLWHSPCRVGNPCGSHGQSWSWDIMGAAPLQWFLHTPIGSVFWWANKMKTYPSRFSWECFWTHCINMQIEQRWDEMRLTGLWSSSYLYASAAKSVTYYVQIVQRHGVHSSCLLEIQHTVVTWSVAGLWSSFSLAASPDDIPVTVSPGMALAEATCGHPFQRARAMPGVLPFIKWTS